MDKVTESFVDDMRLVLLNSEGVTNEVMSRIAQSIINDDAATNDPDAYRPAHDNHDGNWHAFVSCAALEVRDYVQDSVDELPNGLAKDVLEQFLRIGDYGWYALTESIMPEPDDVDDYR